MTTDNATGRGCGIADHHLSSVAMIPSLCHHNAPLVLFALPSLAVLLDLQVQAPIISSSSSEKFGAVIDGRREGDRQEEAGLASV